MPDIANLRSNTWKVTIGASEAELAASVQIGGGYDLVDVMTQMTGTDIIARLVQGRQVELTFDWQEDDEAVLKRALGLSAAGDMLDVGAQLPTTTVLLHPASLPDGTEDHDLYLYALSFGRLERTTNGQGVAIWRTPAKAQRDANGKVGRLGPAAP